MHLMLIALERQKPLVHQCSCTSLVVMASLSLNQFNLKKSQCSS